MLEWYILSVCALALAFDQHRSLQLANYQYPFGGLRPGLTDLAAWVGGIGTLALLVAGFFIGRWWWPLLAMAVGTAINFTGRSVVTMEIRWAAVMIACLAGLAAAGVLFSQVF